MVDTSISSVCAIRAQWIHDKQCETFVIALQMCKRCREEINVTLAAYKNHSITGTEKNKSCFTSLSSHDRNNNTVSYTVSFLCSAYMVVVA